MKKILFYAALIAACTTAVSCDVNKWNENLDGFKGDKSITNTQTVEYTLTNTDYSNLAANSDNVTKAANADLSKELKAVGTQYYFTDKITAKDYVPNFLSDPDFAYFTLSDGSSINLTYNVGKSIPEITAFASAKEYTITDDDYMYAWDDEYEYVESFTPEVSAKSNIPSILAKQFPDAASGDMIVVNYNEASKEPEFGGNPQPETFQLTSVLGTATVGSSVEVKGIVSAICNRGFILSDNSGSILVYYASGFDATAYKIGDQIELKGEVSSYGTALQITGTSATVEVKGNQTYSYPTPTVMTGPSFDEAVTRTENSLAIYAKFTATVKISGNYYNFTIDGASTAQGSLYQATTDQKALFTDGQSYTITGYFVSISGGRYVNFVIVDVQSASAAPLFKASIKSSTFTVESESVSAVYEFDGSKWSENSDIYVIQPSDYTDMGQKYKNLTDPDFYLPRFLSQKKPYAQAEDTQLIAYKYYKSGTTTLVCDQYEYDGTTWVKFNGMVVESAQFVKTGGKWMYDPNVSITLPTGKGQELSTTYYQACVNWVFENIDKPLGSTDIKSGSGYVTSYGNNEYYSGTSAYQGNVDLRPAKAIEQYPNGYEGKTNDEVAELMKTRFCKEVMPGALKTLHPDAAPIDGLNVIYSITFGVYTGSATETHTVRYKVVAQGEFEYIDCTWWSE